ncbi:MAG: hypothetical protein Q4G70_05300 [Pseudomonadota bacterium]|nr:hypothetical protein [Pseudomonadota bacterium]
MACTLAGPLLALGWTWLTQPAQQIVFSVQGTQPPRLRAVAPESPVPDLQPGQVPEFWASLPAGERITLPVRRGMAGLWWQYDGSVLTERVQAFYSAH